MADRENRERLYRYLLDETPILFFRLDREGKILRKNRYAAGVTGEEVPGQPFLDLVVDLTGSMHFQDLLDGQDRERMLNINTLSGLPRTFTFSFIDAGQEVLALGKLDQEEQDRLQEEILDLNRQLNNLTRELHKKNAELNRLNVLKNQFLGMAAHDLRKPVGIILSYSEFLQDELAGSLGEEHREFLSRILSSSISMGRLIDDFLDVSMIESGRFELDLQPEEMQGILNRAAFLVELQARKKQVTISSRVAPEVSTMAVDGPKLEQALGNLLSNAVDYSPEGARVSVDCVREAGSAVISVSDQGPGIPPEEAKEIFRPFRSSRSQQTAGRKNVGLGLAIAGKIIQEHGGRIWVESEPGQGSRFRFSLPCPNEGGDP